MYGQQGPRDTVHILFTLYPTNHAWNDTNSGSNILQQLTFHNRLVRTHRGHHLQMNLWIIIFSIEIMFHAKHEIIQNDIISKCASFPVLQNTQGEILPKVCEISQTFVKISHHAKRRKSQNKLMSLFMTFPKHNFD